MKVHHFKNHQHSNNHEMKEHNHSPNEESIDNEFKELNNEIDKIVLDQNVENELAGTSLPEIEPYDFEDEDKEYIQEPSKIKKSNTMNIKEQQLSFISRTPKCINIKNQDINQTNVNSAFTFSKAIINNSNKKKIHNEIHDFNNLKNTSNNNILFPNTSNLNSNISINLNSNSNQNNLRIMENIKQDINYLKGLGNNIISSNTSNLINMNNMNKDIDDINSNVNPINSSINVINPINSINTINTLNNPINTLNPINNINNINSINGINNLSNLSNLQATTDINSNRIYQLIGNNQNTNTTKNLSKKIKEKKLHKNQSMTSSVTPQLINSSKGNVQNINNNLIVNCVYATPTYNQNFDNTILNNTPNINYNLLTNTPIINSNNSFLSTGINNNISMTPIISNSNQFLFGNQSNYSCTPVIGNINGLSNISNFNMGINSQGTNKQNYFLSPMNMTVGNNLGGNLNNIYQFNNQINIYPNNVGGGNTGGVNYISSPIINNGDLMINRAGFNSGSGQNLGINNINGLSANGNIGNIPGSIFTLRPNQVVQDEKNLDNMMSFKNKKVVNSKNKNKFINEVKKGKINSNIVNSINNLNNLNNLNALNSNLLSQNVLDPHSNPINPLLAKQVQNGILMNTVNSGVSNGIEEEKNKIDIEKVLYLQDKRTTLMIKNIPNKYTISTFLDEINVEFKNRYDIFYLPIDYGNKCNLGFAFINFVDPLHIIRFYDLYRGKKWKRFNSEKICELVYAKIQGKRELITHFEKGKVLSFESEEKRPLILPTPNPLPLIKIPIKLLDNFVKAFPFANYYIDNMSSNDREKLQANGLKGSNINIQCEYFIVDNLFSQSYNNL